MTNKRQLKKHIQYVCGDIATELLIARALYPGFDNEKVGEIIDRLAALQTQTLKNTSFGFDRSARDFEDKSAYNKARAEYTHAAYGKLKAEFDAQIAEIVKQMNALMPEALRSAKKA